MKKVFICEYIHPKVMEWLSQRVEIISDPKRLSEVDAVINRNMKIDELWMQQCPKLKVIGIHGTGMDDVDLEAAEKRHIAVVNTPYENALSVAELIIALMLNMARKIPQADRMQRSGVALETGDASLSGHEISGKVFGMIGCGHIALKAADILSKGFGMKIIGYSRSLTEEKAKQLAILRCDSIESVFEQADFINIGVALTQETKGMIHKDVLKHAKKGAVLINTSRGAVVDEDALLEALKDGTLAAAAGDVFVNEPLSAKHPLFSCDNFLATPHIGANTDEALYRVGQLVAEKVIHLLGE